MQLQDILKELSLSNYPAGLGGCQSDQNNFDCCEFNITVFDNKKGETVHEVDNKLVKIHHGILSETNPEILNQFQNMKIILDEQWKVRMFLSEIKEKKMRISKSCTKSCLVDAGVLATQAKEASKHSTPLASMWLKCGAYFLADAISIANSTRPSPTHMLGLIREFEKNRLNESFAMVHQSLGLERTTTSLLERMFKSTVGFSDIVEKNNHSKIIAKKYHYFIQHSLLSDCYFYLGYINRNNIMKIKDSFHRHPDFLHILRVGLDLENDPLVVEHQTSSLLKTVNDLLSNLKNQSL